MRSSDEQIESWLVKNGYRQNFFVRYGQWLGVWPKQPNIDPETGEATPRFTFCNEPAETAISAASCRAISAARPSSRRRSRQSCSRRSAPPAS